ncbi:MAG: hypothetical protein HYY23_10285 [Verrucomicrobia bacterium]|nr:hypothetical protein [Verrucomicrobiota bacterium]
MKTNPTQQQITRRGRILSRVAGSIVIGLLLATHSLPSNAASRGPALASPHPLDEATRAALGKICVVTAPNSVELRFDKSDGRRFDAEEAAIEGAGGPKELGRKIMEQGAEFAGDCPIPHPGHAIIALGAAIEELAPIGAIFGVNGSKHATLSSDQLTELESELARVMRTVGVHARLRDDFMKLARERTGRALIVRDGLDLATKDPAAYEALVREGVQTILELALERVHLRRFAKSDDSFALVVNARARIIQTREAAVLCDLPFEYRSGSGLFLDWTLNHADAFQRAFETASRRLAAEMVRVLFLESGHGDALARGGTQHSAPSRATLPLTNGEGRRARDGKQVNLASHPTTARTAAGSGKNQGRVQPPPAVKTQAARANSPKITFVERPPLASQILANLGKVGIISTSTLPHIAVQRPLSKKKAALEACDDAQQILNDYGSPFALLVNGPMNFARGRRPIEADGGAGGTILGPIADAALRSGAAVISTPIGIGVGLGGQAYGAAHGLSDKALRATDNAVTRAVTEAHPQDSLRAEVLRQAQQRTTHPIALVKKPFPAGEEEMFSQMACVMAGTLAWVPEGQTPAYYLTSQGIDTALEIQLLHPALNGQGTINPPMALSMDVRASLIRVRDREPLYSFAMNYRGPERKFAEWAAHNAQSLREELERCCQTVAATIVEQLAVHAWPRELPLELVDIKR